MRGWWLAVALILLGGCEAVPARKGVAPANATDALGRLEEALAGDYDNDEQVRAASSAALSGSRLAVPHLREHLRRLEHGRGGDFWLWQLQQADQANTASSSWVYRIAMSGDGQRVILTPYRALDPAKVAAEFADPKLEFRFVPERWAELAPCALSGEWKNQQFVAAADAGACSALLPGLGEAAALLPLRFMVDGEMLRTATFADQARGADAAIEARLVRWFVGWSAINGGGPNAKPGNQDWHTHDDLRVSSSGGRVALRWRDGAASGYSLELQRRSYPERKLTVLQLNVIEDATGRAIGYTWTSPNADIIGINLGWLQVGLIRPPPG